MSGVPAVVIGGYLGAGKTTLVNHLLRHAAGRRIAVLVNDFGELAIDADLIEGASGQVLALAGGCVCCSFGDDLLSGLNTVLQRTPAPEVVLIECSGVGLPASVARTARLCTGLELQGVVGVLDAETLRQRAADAYVGDTVRQQLREADLFLLNKADLLPAPALAGLRAWLAAEHPLTPLLACERGQVPPEVVLGLHPQPADEPGTVATRPLRPAATLPQAHAHELLRFDSPVDLAALLQGLADPAAPALRAKGSVQGQDGQRWLLQGVGRRLEATPWPAHQPWPGGRLLVIRARTG